MKSLSNSWPWWTGLVLSLVGLAVGPSTGWVLGGMLLSLGLTLLSMRAIMVQHMGRTADRALRLTAWVQMGTLVTLVVFLGLFGAILPPTWRVALIAGGVQLAITALASHPLRSIATPGQVLVPAIGHIAVFGGSMALVTGAPVLVAQLSYAGGFALLALSAHWAQQSADQEGRRAWESTFLVIVLAALIAASWTFVVGRFDLQFASGSVPIGESVIAVASVGLLALLSAPPPAPAWLRPMPTSLAPIFAHGAAAIALFNVLFLALAAISQLSARALVVIMALYMAITVALEYAAVRRHIAMRRKRAAVASGTVMERVTAVIAARNERQALAASLTQNLELPGEVKFVLVVSHASDDGTIEYARSMAAAHPTRVRVIVGTSGTKADDLNQAWPSLDTDAILLLDADETITPESLLSGLRRLRSRLDIGVVQGRKVARDARSTPLARFLAAERRHATGIDQPLQAEALGAAHFAGSGAFVRREVAASLGGWRADMLTEDIDFTLRVHLETSWRIVHEPRMVVHEANPHNMHALLRQRTRWSRGWIQCFFRYFPAVARGRRTLGGARAFGLGWLLLTSVSAPIMALLPALVLLRMLGSDVLLPIFIAAPLAALVLPARIIGYTYAAVADTESPMERTPKRFGELALHAYAWVALGWTVQMHAAYLEFSAAPAEWTVTNKRTHPPFEVVTEPALPAAGALARPALAPAALGPARPARAALAPAAPELFPVELTVLSAGESPWLAIVDVVKAADLLDALDAEDLGVTERAAPMARAAFKVIALRGWTDAPTPMALARAELMREALAITPVEKLPAASTVNKRLRSTPPSPLTRLTMPWPDTPSAPRVRPAEPAPESTGPVTKMPGPSPLTKRRPGVSG